MNSLKHSIFLANVSRACCSYAALEFCRLVGDNVAVKVRKNKYLEVLASCRVDKFCGCNVDIPVICYNVRIFLADSLCGFKEFAISCLDDVCFCDD